MSKSECPGGTHKKFSKRSQPGSRDMDGTVPMNGRAQRTTVREAYSPYSMYIQQDRIKLMGGEIDKPF